MIRGTKAHGIEKRLRVTRNQTVPMNVKLGHSQWNDCLYNLWSLFTFGPNLVHLQDEVSICPLDPIRDAINYSVIPHWLCEDTTVSKTVAGPSRLIAYYSLTEVE